MESYHFKHFITDSLFFFFKVKDGEPGMNEKAIGALNEITTKQHFNRFTRKTPMPEHEYLIQVN